MYDTDSNTSDCLKTNISAKEPEKAEKPSQEKKEDQIKERSLVHCNEPLRMQEKTRVMRRSMKMEREVKMPLSFTAPTSGLMFSTRALLDSGATDSFIDKGMIEKYGLEVETLEKLIPVYNADGGCNKLGDITGFVTLRMIHGLHEELMCLYATSLGKETILIGHDWLRKHNPVIDWITGEVEMSRCPKIICGYEHRTKRAVKQRKLRIKRREAKKRYAEFEQNMEDQERKMRQPTCEEVEDKYDFEQRLRSFIVDPYEWDPSAEQSPSEEEQDELCAELLGEKEWEEGDEDDNSKLNEQLKIQGVNRRAR
jgi:predicted aspartyl protease